MVDGHVNALRIQHQRGKVVVRCLKILQLRNLFVKEPFHQPAHHIPEGDLKRHLQDRDLMFSGKLDQILDLVLRAFHRLAPF